jgi:hypothetical protein
MEEKPEMCRILMQFGEKFHSAKEMRVAMTKNIRALQLCENSLVVSRTVKRKTVQ